MFLQHDCSKPRPKPRWHYDAVEWCAISAVANGSSRKSPPARLRSRRECLPLFPTPMRSEGLVLTSKQMYLGALKGTQERRQVGPLLYLVAWVGQEELRHGKNFSQKILEADRWCSFSIGWRHRSWSSHRRRVTDGSDVTKARAPRDLGSLYRSPGNSSSSNFRFCRHAERVMECPNGARG